MAAVGKRHILRQEDIRAAFDKAQDEGKDYLVKVGYKSKGIPMCRTGAPLDVINYNQAAYGVGKLSVAEDLRKIYRECGSLNIIAVYDLSGPFEQAVQGSENLLPQGVLETVRAEMERNACNSAVAVRPFWKKFLGLAP